MRQRGLEVQPPGCLAIAQRASGMPADISPPLRHQRIQRAAHLTRIARHFRHALLVVVEFLERHHRQIDVVFLEAEQASSDRASARSCRARTACDLDPAGRAAALFARAARLGAAAAGALAPGFRLGARARPARLAQRGGFHGSARLAGGSGHRLQQRRGLFRFARRALRGAGALAQRIRSQQAAADVQARAAACSRHWRRAPSAWRRSRGRNRPFFDPLRLPASSMRSGPGALWPCILQTAGDCRAWWGR